MASAVRFGCLGRARSVASVVALAVVVAACSGADPAPPDGESRGVSTTIGTSTTTTVTTVSGGPIDVAVDGTLPLADQALDDPEVTTLASDLAPSQVSGSTVAEPPTPPPCTPDDLALWTARVERGDPTVDAVIRVQNVGDGWCEPDIGRSPLLDPAVEPDVWLLPGDLADLHVGQMSADCVDPSPVSSIQVGIGAESILVPSAVVTCGWWLDAFVPLGAVAQACTAEGLETAVTDLAVVVRSTAGPCTLGDIVAVDPDDGSDVVVDRPEAQPDFDTLFPGDVARVGAVSGETCDDPVGQVTLRGVAVGDLELDDVPCDMRFWVGDATPWFGSVPVADALDPFGSLA